jgi:ATPase subunit of ABC transporter with duplicated ATPase domains
MLSKMMLAKGNLILMDEPTNHLDLESITALNNAMAEYRGSLLFTSHDHELVNTVANRIIEITPAGTIDKMMSYDEYLKDDKVISLREEMYA